MASGGSKTDFYESRSFRSRQTYVQAPPPTDVTNANGTAGYSQPCDDQSYYEDYNRGYNRRSYREYGRVSEQGQESVTRRGGSFRGQNNQRGQGQRGTKYTAENNSTSGELGFEGDAFYDSRDVRPLFDQASEQKTRNHAPKGNGATVRNERQGNFNDCRDDKWHRDDSGTKRGNTRRPRSSFNNRTDHSYAGNEFDQSHNNYDTGHLEKNWRKSSVRIPADSKYTDDGLRQPDRNEINADETGKKTLGKSSENCRDGNESKRFVDRNARDGDNNNKLRYSDRGQSRGRLNKSRRGSRNVVEESERDSMRYGTQPVDELERDHLSVDLRYVPYEHSDAGDSQTSGVRQSVASSVVNRGSGARKKSGNWRDGGQEETWENCENLDGESGPRGRRQGNDKRRGALNDRRGGENRNRVESEGGRHDVDSREALGVRDVQVRSKEEDVDGGIFQDSGAHVDRKDGKRTANYRNVTNASTKNSKRQTRGRWDDGRYSTDYNNRGGNEGWKHSQQGANWQRVNGSDAQLGWHDAELINEQGNHPAREERDRLKDASTKTSSNREATKSKDVETISSKEGDARSPRNPEARHSNRLTRNKDDDFPRTASWQDETQRGLLIDQLCGGKYECLVCFNIVRSDSAVWSCSSCYHIYHLYCIKKWAQSSAAAPLPDGMGTAWRCPTCQSSYLQVPNQYTCFCGKERDPEFNRYATPHSCNETCSRERNRGCPHLCTLLCHPGPCPPCSAFITRSCDCGKTKRSVKCVGDATSFKCTEPCGRTLNCGQHMCKELCHAGSCDACTVDLERGCYCGQETRTVRCGSGEAFLTGLTCEATCGRRLECGRHDCVEKCHPGPCVDCPRRPDVVTRCACGKTPLLEILGAKPRETCEDPIATCEKVCDKELACGNEGSRHRCRHRCHEGPCPTTCDRTTDVTCRCGAVTKEMSCVESLELSDATPFVCDRRCKKKMSCGRHRCNQMCCTSEEHLCQFTCGYKLGCGLHRCEEPCHKGNCPSCWQVSFDELRCYCGAEVIYPPVACGTKPPECIRPCTRQHTCNHPATHHCHSDEVCPPCTVLTEKWCLGRHELRRNIPCYVAEISCGMQCGKELPCLVHKCQQSCHKGACLEGKVCTQPCPMIRSECSHPCQAPCHPDAPCPATVCKAEVTMQCDCGRRKEKGQCMRGHDANASGQSDYSKMTAQLVASKLWEGQSIDLSVLCKELGNKKTRKLQCNSECSIQERNQRLALALEIKNPDLSSKLGNPPYSQFLKDFARQTPTFVAGVEKALSDLVTASQQPRMTRKIHSFKIMPSSQRRVIHELAEFYGCQTESYDEEPNKNVVATAIKDKCWLPSVTLTSLVQRELFPKAPVPIPINCKEDQIRSAAQAAKQSTQVFAVPSSSSSSSNRSTSGGQASGAASSNRRNNEPKIDYFDFTD